MSKTPPSETKEIFSNTQNLGKFFDEFEKSIKQYHLMATTLQSECAQSCKKILETQISAQQEFFTKSGFDKNSNEPIQKTMNQYFDSMAKLVSTQNQIMTNIMESCRQNVRLCSENWSKFAEQNSKIMQSWNPGERS
ncbi:MAG: hypothetical protein LV477_02575 [Candidatus Nitrosotalea sp.]|nr:hypothetical protein [Candidatus Nitrosotalea sp.]